MPALRWTTRGRRSGTGITSSRATSRPTTTSRCASTTTGSGRRCMPKRRPKAPVLRLVQPQPNAETVKRLRSLLAAAVKGEIIGLAYVAMYSQREYLADFCGETRRSPTLTRGMLRALDDDLRRLVSPAE